MRGSLEAAGLEERLQARRDGLAGEEEAAHPREEERGREKSRADEQLAELAREDACGDDGEEGRSEGERRHRERLHPIRREERQRVQLEGVSGARLAQVHNVGGGEGNLSPRPQAERLGGASVALPSARLLTGWRRLETDSSVESQRLTPAAL